MVEGMEGMESFVMPMSTFLGLGIPTTNPKACYITEKSRGGKKLVKMYICYSQSVTIRQYTK